MTVRVATCRCGALKATARGDPSWVSVCHCLACKARTGGAFSWGAHYPEAQVETEGEPSSWSRTSESGRECTYYFCPDCGSTAWYRIEARPGMVTVPAGNFADPDFGEPLYSGFEARRCPWVLIETEGELQRR